jgi:hypothetical protein
MGYTITVSRPGVSAITFPITPLFNFSLNQVFDDLGKRTGGEFRMPFLGKFVDDASAASVSDSVFDQAKELEDLINFDGPLSFVRITLDATTKREILASQFAAGPFIENFDTVPPRGDGPNFVNEVEFTFEVVGRLSRNSDDPQTGGDVEGRTVQKDFFNKRQMRTTWVARARGDGARDKLKDLEPKTVKDKAYQKSTIRQVDENAFEIQIIWERWQTNQLISWSERVTTVPAGRPKVTTPITGNKPAIVRDGRIFPLEVIVDGRMTSNEKNLAALVDPDFFLNEKFLDRRRSNLGAPPELTNVAGIFQKEYRQVFVISEHIVLPITGEGERPEAGKENEFRLKDNDVPEFPA